MDSCIVRQLNSQSDIVTARRLIGVEYGEQYGDRFLHEALQIMERPPSAVVGCYATTGTLLGVGCVIKESFDYAYWSLTWIVVDEKERGKGIGSRLVDALLDVAKVEQTHSHNPNCRMILTTTIPAFYAVRWGFQTVATGPLEGEHLMMADIVGPGLSLRACGERS